MLILTRRAGESIMIGNDVKITVTRVAVDKVRIGIEAPKHVAVYREELYETLRGKQTVTLKHLVRRGRHHFFRATLSLPSTSAVARR
jgi:carbon storage regulator